MSLDIIHPRNQGNPEAGFIEPWAERKARNSGRDVPAIKKPISSSNARRTDPRFRSAFLALYRDGLSHKRMAMELGVDPRTIGRAVKAYGLKPRTRRTSSLPHNVEFKFHLPEDLFAAMKKHCVGRHRSMAEFVRRVIADRLDASSGRPPQTAGMGTSGP